jgi:hypothetical protein
MAFTARTDKRISHVEERTRHEVSRLTERLYAVNRQVQEIQGVAGTIAPPAREQSERE